MTPQSVSRAAGVSEGAVSSICRICGMILVWLAVYLNRPQLT